ncbi:NAD kinase [Actinobacteria bacterium IMCC26103]|nr:NAD kinase [Actinobacteria bacterium IMCC26103]
MSRHAIFVINPSRTEAVSAAKEISQILLKEGFQLSTPSDVNIIGITQTGAESLAIAEIVIVLGGDGTILRGAEIARTQNIPILGINLGHVGFLAEVEKPALTDIAASIVAKNFVTENRMVLQYSVIRESVVISTGWALNEVTVERNGTTMVELFVQIDNRPLSRWGCDGLICSTPTGSTAYAFSAGGPVLWPEIDALVLLPISAHALFARPMVVAPTSQIVVKIESSDALLSADALRKLPLRSGDRVQITKDSSVIKLSHINPTLFTDRLVAKFKLPVEGWRGE